MHSYYFRFLIGCLTVVTFACQSPVTKDAPQAVSPQPDTAQKQEAPAPVNIQPLEFLRSMDGKSFQSEHLFSHEVIAARLRKLMGDERFGFMRETWAVEDPISISKGIFSAEGCMRHNCGSTNFIIVADLKKNTIYTGIREDGQVKTWGEDSTVMPDISAWSNRKED